MADGPDWICPVCNDPDCNGKCPNCGEDELEAGCGSRCYYCGEPKDDPQPKD